MTITIKNSTEDRSIDLAGFPSHLLFAGKILMKSGFGKRNRTVYKSVHASNTNCNNYNFRKFIIINMTIISSIMSLHVAYNVLKIESQLPVGSLLSSIPYSKLGWTPWYGPPILSCLLVILVCLRFVKSSMEPPSHIILVALGFTALFIGSLAANSARNIGYTVFFVPGASIVDILAAAPSIIGFNISPALISMNESMLPFGIVSVVQVAFGIALGAPVFSKPIGEKYFGKSEQRR